HPVLPTGTRRRSFLARRNRAVQGQPLERRPVPLRVNSAPKLLGHGSDGRIPPPDPRLRRRRRQSRRSRRLPDVQPRDCETEYTEISLLGSRSPVSFSAL